jgi:hypothetical protein
MALPTYLTASIGLAIGSSLTFVYHFFRHTANEGSAGSCLLFTLNLAVAIVWTVLK